MGKVTKTKEELISELADMQIKYERALIILDWCKSKFGWFHKRQLAIFMKQLD